jgi:hypothetical protein
VHRSLRRRSQLLVVVAALLGAVIGVALGMVGDGGGTSPAAAAPGPARGAAPATTPPSSHPPAPRAGSSGEEADAGDFPGHRRAESADRPGKGNGKATPGRHDRDDKSGGHTKDKGDKGKDK